MGTEVSLGVTSLFIFAEGPEVYRIPAVL